MLELPQQFFCEREVQEEKGREYILIKRLA